MYMSIPVRFDLQTEIPWQPIKGIKIAPTASNPNSSEFSNSTLWFNSTDGHLYVGATDIQTGGVTGPNISEAGNLAIFSNSTGDELSNSFLVLSESNDGFSITSDGNNLLTVNNNEIRIGTYSAEAFMCGIHDSNTYNGDHRVVHVDSSGKLHTTLAGLSTLIGELFYDNPVTDTLALTFNTAAKIAPATLFAFNGGGFNSPNNGDLRYLGIQSRTAQVRVSICARLVAGSNCLLNFDIYKNGSKVTGSGSQVTFVSSGVFQTHSFQKLVNLDTNDVLSVFATNLTDSNDIQIQGFNLTASVVN